jgi:hypothetical protein
VAALQVDPPLRVFLDEKGVERFGSITDAIGGALARSRALVALYSSDYARRTACQWS